MEIKSVTKSVVEYLRSEIIIGRLKAGQKLNENDLALNLNISRHPIREAFRILENEHLVISIPRKGTYVSELSIEDLQGLYQAREMIECYAIELLEAQNIRNLPLVVSALETGSNLSIQDADSPEGMLEYLKSFAGYHIKLVESTGNPWLIHFYNSISSHLARYQCIYLYIPNTRKNSLEIHRQVLEFIKKGSFDQAKQHLGDHIKNTFEKLKSKILQNIDREEKSEV